jgi:hypothetical protein
MNRPTWPGALLAAALALCASARADSTAEPPGQPLAAVPSHVAGATTLLVQDVQPWGTRSNEKVLRGLGVAFDIVHSGSLGAVDLEQYSTIVIASVQTDRFYGNLGKHVDAIDAWLRHGPRTLEFHAARYSDTLPWNWKIPGGLRVHTDLEGTDTLSGVESPLTQGLPQTMTGTYASHVVFKGRPHHTDRVLITTGGSRAVLVDYCLGPGRVIATGQTVEFAVSHDWDWALVLTNMLSASALTPGCPG